MARYFGGFRDRLKKRSRNLSLSERDIEWVQVATTFSWSPARRDYQWLEPEDYLSSFLNSSSGDDSFENEVGGEPAYSAGSDSEKPLGGQDTLTKNHETDQVLEYVPPYDFESSFDAEGSIPSSEVDIQAELPHIEEYKLEINSALQRRGIHIDEEQISIPEELKYHLNNYHEKGRSSIDSYELRARLQNYKKQVIESYEGLGGVSSGFHSFDKGKQEAEFPESVEQREPKKKESGNYESFIVSSLNRLEATMRSEETTQPQASREDVREALDQPIRSDSESKSEPDSIVPPSSFADDSWLVLPIDNAGANAGNLVGDKEPGQTASPWDIFHTSTENARHLNEDKEDHSTESKPDNRLEKSSELLQALNTINSQLSINSNEGEELNDAPKLAENSVGDPIENKTTPPIEEGRTTPSAYSLFKSKQGVKEKRKEEKRNRGDGKNDSSEKHDSTNTPIPVTGTEDIQSKDGTSLSELLLRLRHEGDKPGELRSEVREVPQPEVKQDNVLSVPDVANDIEETSKSIEDQSALFLDHNTSDARTDFTVQERNVSNSGVEAEPKPEENESNETVESLRALYIEEERKKLYSLIGKLEESNAEQTQEQELPKQPIAQGVVEHSTPKQPPLRDTVEDNFPYEESQDVQPEPAPDSRKRVISTFVPKEDNSTVETGRQGSHKLDVTESIQEESLSSAEKANFGDSDMISVEKTLNFGRATHRSDSEPIGKPRDETPQKSSTRILHEEADSSHLDLLDSNQPKQSRDIAVDQDLKSPFTSSNGAEKGTLLSKEPPHEAKGSNERELGITANENRSSMKYGHPTEYSEERGNIDMPKPQKDKKIAVVDALENQEETNSIISTRNSPKDAPPAIHEMNAAILDEGNDGEVSLRGAIECLAFAAEEPIPLKRVARLYAELQGDRMPTVEEISKEIEQLNKEYAEQKRVFRIKIWGGGIRMATHPQYAKFVRGLYQDNRPKKLSRTLMETLSIIAYSQPTTKPEIDFVRGVDSDYAVRKLLELGLIDIVGRSDSIGRPLLYGTSERFLDQFGLSELEALPKLREVEELLGDPAFKKERLHLLALEGLEENSDDASSAAPPQPGNEPS